MVENTERLSPHSVRILKSVRENEGLLRRGAEARKGERILQAGRKIGLADIGLLASTGKAERSGFAKAAGCVIATGDELVEVDDDSATRSDSQQQHLHDLRASPGSRRGAGGPGNCAATISRICGQKFAQGLEHDILLVSGGVSMGKYDLVETVFAEFGVEVLFDEIAMKPGKPTVFGHRGETYVFGLPGNPISTMVAFHMFVRPLILFLLKAENTRPQDSRSETGSAGEVRSGTRCIGSGAGSI